MNHKSRKLPDIIPLLPMRDSIIFPRMVIPLMVQDSDYSRLIDDTLKKDKLMVVSLIVHPEKTGEGYPEVHRVGTAVRVIKLAKSDTGTVLVVQGIARVDIEEIVSREPYLKARIKRLREVIRGGQEVNAMKANLVNLFQQIVELSPHLPQELAQLSRDVDHPGALSDMLVSTLNLDRAKKQEILEALDVRKRLERTTFFLNEELELQKMGKKIHDEVTKGMDKSQREYYLREQMKAIQKELGVDAEEASEADELHTLLEKKNLPEHVLKAAEKEIGRLSRMHPSSSEYSVSRTYLDWLLDVPWLEATEDSIDLKRAEEVLNRHHYDLEKVKKRILEFLAVRKLNPRHKGPILCLVGPPGTGKTSLGRSIAEALGRKFVRISLGGIRDEAEIRGHRRTYVGALPGRIVQGIKKAGSNNPVFVLDEIDKVGTDFRGDPSSALLEALDPEQNFSFSDHYLELELDLSRVMFIATANQMEPVPPALRDRMEVLELSGYTEDEKVSIATRFLIPRQVSEHGLNRKRIAFRRPAVRQIIREYTREAGLRNLEREIGALCRGVARKVAGGHEEKIVISGKEVRVHLGKPKFTLDLAEGTFIPGVATGLAWTPAGGDILFVEASMMPGNKSLVLTGQLGEVMKESAHAALSYLRAKAKTLGIDEDFYKNLDLHIHVPAGAIPKDGPSAGVTMLTALASLLTTRPVKPKLAMTGEATLRGNVLPVGGIKDKVLAASRGGIKHVILPEGNRNDLDEIPDNIRKHLTFHLVSKMDEVLDLALSPGRNPARRKQ